MKEKRENLVGKNIDLGRFIELATTIQLYGNGLNLHQIKSEILEDCIAELELIESMLIGETEQKTYFRFKNVDDFEIYIIALDNSGYDSEDVIFKGWLYGINTLEFKKQTDLIMVEVQISNKLLLNI